MQVTFNILKKKKKTKRAINNEHYEEGSIYLILIVIKCGVKHFNVPVLFYMKFEIYHYHKSFSIYVYVDASHDANFLM